MHKRKIQFVGGTTYTVSLPKDWILKNNLREKEFLHIYENNDRSLLISPKTDREKKNEKIVVDADKYSNIADILFTIYYMGFEEIEIKSDLLTKKMKKQVRSALVSMSGTEIVFESEKKMKINVLLDKSKIRIPELLYRVVLILEMSISNILGDIDKQELNLNEMEIDRLYHLMTKMLSMSLVDTNILHSAKIKNITTIPYFFLINKKLESIGDELVRFSRYLPDESETQIYRDILVIMKEELNRAVSYLLKDQKDLFEKISEEEYNSIYDMMNKIEAKTHYLFLKDIIRNTVDIQEAIVKLSYYKTAHKSSEVI